MNEIFKQNLEDTKSPVVIDFSSEGKSLLIAFGGIIGALGMPPFEFFNLTKKIEVKKIYVRDMTQSWYHQGLPGIASDIDGVALFLRKKIEESGAEKIVLIGNSMGGYVAIIFGMLLNMDVAVHAFSPQTFIDKRNRFWHRDNRWRKQIRKIHRIASRRYLDAKVLLLHSHNRKNYDINIYFCFRNRLDKIHAERLSKFDNVSLHPFADGGHTVVKHLRDTGILKEVIVRALT